MKPLISASVFLASFSFAVGAVLLHGCGATGNGHGDDDDGVGNAGLGAGSPGGSGATGGFNPTTGGGGAGGTGVVTDPCASQCGPEEVCNNGLDDNCNGTVDEGCSCTFGAAESCFMGDPSYHAAPGCFAGTQRCTEQGLWGECTGGVHAVEPNPCQEAPQTACHPIATVPFAPVNLSDGVGTFDDDAVSQTYTVTCPADVDPCPGVTGSNPTDDFQPLQSGEYTVTYEKTTATGSDECTFPLFVGAPGLRVELQWEHIAGETDRVDLDLHMHRPASTTPWGGANGNADDCAYNNCVAAMWVPFPMGFGVEWFNGVAPPDPMAWSPQPFTPENTTCYHSPRGVGADWQFGGKGCHNPRLDLDNLHCNPALTDVDDAEFCAPENINIDYPPADQWTRIGVYYFDVWEDETYTNPDPVVHPVVKVFCAGRLAGEFGANYATPVTFVKSDASSRYWLVADVKYKNDPCDPSACEVAPIYGDDNNTTPYLRTATQMMSNFGPPYPP